MRTLCQQQSQTDDYVDYPQGRRNTPFDCKICNLKTLFSQKALACKRLTLEMLQLTLCMQLFWVHLNLLQAIKYNINALLLFFLIDTFNDKLSNSNCKLFQGKKKE